MEGRIPQTVIAGMCVSGLLIVSPLRADDFVTLTATFHDAKVTRIEPDGVCITHKTGVTKIPFSDLSEEMRQNFGYDPGKAAAYAKQQREQATAYAAATAETEKREAKLKKLKGTGVQASVVIAQILPNGILGEGSVFADAGYKIHDEYGTREAGTTHGLGFVFVRTSTQGLADGDVWKGTVWPAGTFRYDATSGAAKTVHQYVSTPEEAVAIAENSGGQ